MKAFYYSQIEQTVTPDGPLITHRIQTAHPGVEHLGRPIQVDPVTVQPLSRGLLVLVAGDDHTRFQGDPKLIPIPMIDLDAAIITMGTEAKLATRAAFVAMGFSQAEADTIWGNSNTLRAALNTLGRQNDPAFDVNAFDLTTF